MGCSEGKQKTYHLAPYYKAYSFDEYILRELDLNDLKNGISFIFSFYIKCQKDYFFNLLRQQYDIPVGTERDDYESLPKNPDFFINFYFNFRTASRIKKKARFAFDFRFLYYNVLGWNHIE